MASSTLAGFLTVSAGDNARARDLLTRVFATGQDPAAHPFMAKYVSAQMALTVVPGVTAELGPDRNGVGLALAELHQGAGDLAAAIDVVEQLEPTTFAALSLAELYSGADRHRDVVELTEGIANDDDATALLCVFRGVAFREQGYFEAAREAFKEALKSTVEEAGTGHPPPGVARTGPHLRSGRQAGHGPEGPRADHGRGLHLRGPRRRARLPRGRRLDESRRVRSAVPPCSSATFRAEQ